MIKKKDKQYMDLARTVAQASKCHRAKFGSVIVSADDRVVSTGFNGKPRGSNCDLICFREGLPPNTPGHNCCIHSEINCLLFSNPVDRNGGTMYVTGKPCNDCTLSILNSGISRVVYLVVESGHPGWGGEDVVVKYGVPLQVVPFKDAEWEEAYGEILHKA